MKRNGRPSASTGSHNRSRLAEGKVAAVDVCDCGVMQIHVGPVTLRMNAAGVSDLMATLGRAIAEQSERSARSGEVSWLRSFPAERGEA